MSEDMQGELRPADCGSVSYGIRSQCNPVFQPLEMFIYLCVCFRYAEFQYLKVIK